MAEPGEQPQPAVVEAAEDEVKAYKIHIPSKHLDLTRQKLELTRLPHQGSEALIEPLIDYWLDTYSFRTIESNLNKTIPQFRVSLPISPAAESSESIRIHFIHSPSTSSPDATPLLLLPPFPLTNLSITHLISSEYHFVIPAYPGTGFSDSLPPDTPSVLESTAHLFNSLMSKLGYTTYLASVTSSNRVDNLLAQHLATQFPDSCVGVNLINPILSPPTLANDPWEWSKYRLARFMRGGLAGYTEEDFEQPHHTRTTSRSQSEPEIELSEPEMLSYALCDSPAGTLATVLRGLKPTITGAEQTKKFTDEELITITNLAWLPGPEGAVRFAVGAKPTTRTTKEKKTKDTKKNQKNKKKKGARVAVTVFHGTPNDGQVKKKRHYYSPPAWANTTYTLSYTQRVKSSRNPGVLLAFEKPEIIFNGIKGLSSAITAAATTTTTTAAKNKAVETAPFQGVIIHPATEQEDTKDVVTTPPDKIILPQPTAPAAAALEMSAISSPASGDTAVEGSGGGGPSPVSVGGDGSNKPSSPSPGAGVRLVAAAAADTKGKGKATDYLEPPAPVRADPLTSDGESPDTLVENSGPPLERTQ